MRYRLMATYRGVPYEVGLGPSNSEVVLFAACPPPEELGFEPATGHWRKPVIRAQIDALWESRPVGMFRGEPCMVLDDPGERLHIAYLGTDAERATSLGYWQVDRGVFELLTPRDEVTELTEERVEKPLRWGELAEGTGPMATYPYGTAPWPVAAPHLAASPLPPEAAFSPPLADAAAEETMPGAGGAPGDAGAADAGPADAGPANRSAAAVASAGLTAAHVPPAGIPAAEAQPTHLPAADAPAAGIPVVSTPSAKAQVSDTPLADALMAETQRARRGAGNPPANGPQPDGTPTGRPADAPVAGPSVAHDPTAERTADVPLAGPAVAHDPTAERPADAPLAGPAVADHPTAERPVGTPLVTAPLVDRPMADDPMADHEAGAPLAGDAMAGTPLADVPLPAPLADDVMAERATGTALADDPMVDRPSGPPLASVPLASVSPETAAPAPVPVPSAVSAAVDDGAQAATGSWPAYPSAGTDPYSGPMSAGDALAYPDEDEPADRPVPRGFHDPPDAAPAGVAPGGDIGGRAARRQRVPTREIFCELADLASIPRAAYALETETDGAICLLPTPDGFDVFIAADGARHELRSFAEEEAAYFYLFGVLAADAIRSGTLAPNVTMANPHGGTV